MIGKVQKAYRDRITGRYVLEGEEVELAEARARELAKGEYVAIVEEAGPEPKPHGPKAPRKGA